MRLPPLHAPARLYLAWIGGLCGAVVLMLADLLPYPLPFATPDAFFGAVVASEIFFVLLIWPLFVPGLVKASGSAPAVLAYAGALILFALPLVLIAANVSGVGAGGVVRSQVLVAALTAPGAAVAARFRSAMPVYFLAAFWLAAAHPFWGFLGHEMGAAAPRLSIYVSPFWGAVADQGAPAWVQAALYGVGGLVLLTFPARKGTA